MGIEERTQFAFADGILHASPHLTAVNGTPVTAGCRAVKSPAELALMRLANDNTLKVYEAAFKSLEPGMTNEHVSQLIGLGYNRTGFPGFASCQVGEYSALPHGSLQPQVIKEGEIILLDDGCTVNDLVRDDDTWASRGDFVRHVSDVTGQLRDDGVLTAREKDAIVRAAARSDVGRQGVRTLNQIR